jgi:phage-related protein
MGQGLHELRCVLSGGRACRVFFFVDTNEKMVLLHAMVKKTQKTPGADLVLARQRMRLFLAENRR